MVGLVIATHGALARTLLAEALRVTGAVERVEAVEVSTEVPLDELRERFARAVLSVDEGDGTLVLVDLLGGTPCNLGMGLSQRARVEVVAGVNLPMLFRALLRRSELELGPLADDVAGYAARAISVPTVRLRRQESPRAR